MSGFYPMIRKSLLAISPLALIAACAPSQNESLASADAGSAARQCFFSDQANSFRAADANTIYVRTSRNTVFQLQARGACNDLDYANGLAILPQGGASNLCTGDTARIALAGTGLPSTGPCLVQVIKQLSPAELEALPRAQRP